MDFIYRQCSEECFIVHLLEDGDYLLADGYGWCMTADHHGVFFSDTVSVEGVGKGAE